MRRVDLVRLDRVRHRLYVHRVWTTRGRECLIDRDLAKFLCRFLRAIGRVHPSVPISRLVKRLKGASSAVATQEGLGKHGRLYWAKGYSVQSVKATRGAATACRAATSVA